MLTPKVFRELFVVVFLHVGTRRVFLTPARQHPNEAWITEQAAAFVRYAHAQKLGSDLIMHDRDTKFTAAFDATLTNAGIDARRSAYRAPNTAAYVERFVQSIKQECLDYFIVVGQRHMDYLSPWAKMKSRPVDQPRQLEIDLSRRNRPVTIVSVAWLRGKHRAANRDRR